MSDLKVNEVKTDAIKNQAGTSAIAIDTSGRLTIPKVPAFKCRGYGAIQNAATVNGVSVATGTDIIYNYQVVDINRDSAFNNSTGIYTVPVAGLYHVECGFGYKASTNYLMFCLFLTSGDNTSYGNVASWANNDNYHTGRHMATIVEASVGQEFAVGMSDSYSNPSTNDTSSGHYTWFSAYLIG